MPAGRAWGWDLGDWGLSFCPITLTQRHKERPDPAPQEARGIHPQAIAEFLTEHWAWALFGALGSIASIAALVLM